MELRELARGSTFVQLELETKYEGRMRFQIEAIEFEGDIIVIQVGLQARYQLDGRRECWVVLPTPKGMCAPMLRLEVTKAKKPWGESHGKIVFATSIYERGALFPANHPQLIAFEG